jgi:hypothetical protein
MWVGEVLPLIIRRRHVMISDLSLSLARSLASAFHAFKT